MSISARIQTAILSLDNIIIKTDIAALSPEDVEVVRVLYDDLSRFSFNGEHAFDYESLSAKVHCLGIRSLRDVSSWASCVATSWVSKFSIQSEFHRSSSSQQKKFFLVELRSFYARLKMEEMLPADMSPTDKLDFFLRVAPFIERNSNSDQWKQLFDLFLSMPKNELSQVAYYSRELCLNLSDLAEKIAVVQAVFTISFKERDLFLTEFKEEILRIPTSRERASFITNLHGISQEYRRASLVEVAKFFPIPSAHASDFIRIYSCIADEEKDDFICACSKISDSISDPQQKLALIQNIQYVTVKSRDAFCSLALEFLGDEATESNLMQFITLLRHHTMQNCVDIFDKTERMADTDENIKNKLSKIETLSFMTRKERSQVQEICSQDFFHSLPIRSKNMLIRSFVFFLPSETHPVMQDMLDSLIAKSLSGIPCKDVYELINLSFKNIDPQKRELLREALLFKISQMPMGYVRRGIAVEVFNHIKSFMTDHESLFAQNCLAIILTDPKRTSLQDPYNVFKKVCEANNDSAYENTKRFLIDQQYFSINPDSFKDLQTKFVSRDEVLRICKGAPVTVHEWLSFIRSFRFRVDSLPQSKKQALLKYVVDSCGFPFKNLCENFTSPFFVELLDAPIEEVIPVMQAYFQIIAKYILDKSNHVREDELCSDAEELFLKYSTSIQNCSAGKSEGTVALYHTLEPEYRFKKNNLKFLSKADIDIREFIGQTLQTTIEEMLATNSAFLSQITREEGRIKQLSHQSLYLKNMLSTSLSLAHKTTFDVHSECIYRSLLEYDLPGLLDVFFEHFTPQLLIDKAKKDFDIISKHHEKLALTLFNSVNQHLKDLSPEDVWDINSDSDNLIQLKDKGALYLLCKSEVLKNH